MQKTHTPLQLESANVSFWMRHKTTGTIVRYYYYNEGVNIAIYNDKLCSHETRKSIMLVNNNSPIISEEDENENDLKKKNQEKNIVLNIKFTAIKYYFIFFNSTK